jgi:hypothetical protein
MKERWMLLILFLSSVYLQAQEVKRVVYFDKNSDKVKEEFSPLIQTMLEELKKTPDLYVLVDGHTDSDGSETFNQSLAYRRCMQVARLLREAGIKNVRFTSFGETQLLNQEANETEKALNRRVEISFISKKEAELYSEIPGQAPLQSKVIEPTKDNFITFKQGTKLKIPANSLVLPNGMAPQGKVKVELIEYYNVGQMLWDGITTTSNVGLIETAGTVFVRARYNGTDLLLKQPAELTFAQMSPNDNMELFITDPLFTNS